MSIDITTLWHPLHTDNLNLNILSKNINSGK